MTLVTARGKTLQSVVGFRVSFWTKVLCCGVAGQIIQRAVIVAFIVIEVRLRRVYSIPGRVLVHAIAGRIVADTGHGGAANATRRRAHRRRIIKASGGARLGKLKVNTDWLPVLTCRRIKR